MNSKTEKICTVLVILYVALFSLVMAKINNKYMYPYGEWDDYSLPAVSILNESSEPSIPAQFPSALKSVFLSY